jgi:hypothetical protein
MLRKLVTPTTVMTVGILASIYAFIAWGAIAMRLAAGVWPSTVKYASDTPFVVEVLMGIGSAVAVVLLFRYRRRLKRDLAGLCRTCGYDLRASKDKCPECGTAIAGSSRPGDEVAARR